MIFSENRYPLFRTMLEPSTVAGILLEIAHPRLRADPREFDASITISPIRDGDGTVIKDTLNPDGTVLMHCTQALKDGKPRFVDGISVELNFTTTPVKSLKAP